MFQTKPTAPVNKQSVIIRILSEAICSLYEQDSTTHKRHSKIGFTNARLSSLQGQRRFLKQIFLRKARDGKKTGRFYWLLQKGFQISRLNGCIMPFNFYFRVMLPSSSTTTHHSMSSKRRDPMPSLSWVDGGETWKFWMNKGFKKSGQLLSTPGVF